MSEFMTFLSGLTELPGFWVAAGGAAVGAVTGAIVSSFFSYWIQSRAFKREEKVRAAEYKRSQQALGSSLIFKLSRIHSKIVVVHRHIEGSIQSADQSQTPMEPWGLVQPLATLPDAVRFSFGELGLLMGLGNDNLYDKVSKLEDAQISILGSFEA